MPERMLFKRTTVEIAQKWHTVKIQMVQDLNQPREKLATKHDWLISALYALASSQLSSEPKAQESLDKAIKKLRDLYVVDPLKPSDADLNLITHEEKRPSRARPVRKPEPLAPPLADHVNVNLQDDRPLRIDKSKSTDRRDEATSVPQVDEPDKKQE